MKFLLPTLLLLLVGCNKQSPVSKKTNLNTVTIPSTATSVSLIFGHNINGETHPCGCREHPLGGLPQVAGALKEVRDKNPVIYIDSGDMLFSTNKLPSSVQKSLKFTAESLVKAMNTLKLNYATPGDYDLTAGHDYLQTLASKMNYPYLISNPSEKLKLGQKPFDIIEAGEAKIFLTGVVSPVSLPTDQQKYFTDPNTALKKTIDELKSKGFDHKNPKHFLILISHSGIEKDEEIAKKFPQFDWIIGSHSQKFTQEPLKFGNTKLVQVLSRNHYVGHINLNLKDPKKTTFDIIQTRDELKDKIKPNPMIAFLEEHKNGLQQVQFQEQEALRGQAKAGEKFPPASSCIECHESQGTKWHKTAHSLALTTLINAKADKNPQCIGCHSVGHKTKEGFLSLAEIALVKVDNDPDKLEAAPKLYWEEINEIAKKIDSVRELKPEQRMAFAKKTHQIEKKFEVLHQFGNVQCLNCHAQSIDHPFEGTSKLTKADKKLAIKNQCLSCHNYDQSPKWYKGSDTNHQLDETVFKKHYDEIACPKYVSE